MPPGRARLATSPVPTGSPAAAKTIGISEVAFLTAMTAAVPGGDDDGDVELNEFGCERGVAVLASFGPAILDDDVAAVDPAELAQPLHKGGDKGAPDRRRDRAQKADGRRACQAVARAWDAEKLRPPEPRHTATRRTFAGAIGLLRARIRVSQPRTAPSFGAAVVGRPARGKVRLFGKYHSGSPDRHVTDTPWVSSAERFRGVVVNDEFAGCCNFDWKCRPGAAPRRICRRDPAARANMARKFGP